MEPMIVCTVETSSTQELTSATITKALIGAMSILNTWISVFFLWRVEATGAPSIMKPNNS